MHTITFITHHMSKIDPTADRIETRGRGLAGTVPYTPYISPQLLNKDRTYENDSAMPRKMFKKEKSQSKNRK